MANIVYHPSIEGAQHGAKSLTQFLAYARKSGAAGAQPSNFMLNAENGFLSPKDIRTAFIKAHLVLDGISAHCPFWVHTTAWTQSPTIRPFIPADVAKKSPAQITPRPGAQTDVASSVSPRPWWSSKVSPPSFSSR